MPTMFSVTVRSVAFFSLLLFNPLLPFQMQKLRRMLTEILLEVTNEEIVSLVQDVYEEENNKLRFEFKTPQFKPERAKPDNVLGKSL